MTHDRTLPAIIERVERTSAPMDHSQKPPQPKRTGGLLTISRSDWSVVRAALASLLEAPARPESHIAEPGPPLP